jgi:hypothetical protein
MALDQHGALLKMVVILSQHHLIGKSCWSGLSWFICLSARLWDGAPLDLEGHGLARLAFQLTAWTDHIVKEMPARLTACKTVVKGGLKLPPFLHEAFHIAGDESKRGNGKAFAAGPTGW